MAGELDMSAAGKLRRVAITMRNGITIQPDGLLDEAANELARLAGEVAELKAQHDRDDDELARLRCIDCGCRFNPHGCASCGFIVTQCGCGHVAPQGEGSST